MTDELRTPVRRRLQKITAVPSPQSLSHSSRALNPELPAEPPSPQNLVGEDLAQQIPSTSKRPERRFAAAWLWLCVLLLAHVPHIATEFQLLWRLEHYQFFPFALLTFGVLFYQRVLPRSFRWTWSVVLLVAADVVLLGTGVSLNSGFLVYSGAILLMLAACRAVSDAEYDTSLSYLILMPLITLRLPLGMDTQAIHWLQHVTTGVFSQVLNYAGFLHLRVGNVLEFPGKRFLVEEACSGIQSLFTVMFLAALISCGYRRSLFHTLFLLASAVCFAGVLNVIRISAISVAWSAYQWDLSVGWQHDMIGYLALIFAVGLVLSADATLDFFCSSVPDIPGGGISVVFRNPLTFLWNGAFLIRPRMAGGGKLNTSDIDDITDRAAPGFFDLLRPRNAISWTLNFIECWFFSRPYYRLALGLPFLAVGVGGVLFVSWLRSAPRDALVGRYEAAATEALKDDDAEAAELYLNGLVQLRPLDKRYRFQLALHQIEHDQTANAISHLTELTGSDGHVPARLWLVNQATQQEPVFPLTPDQIEQQLRAVRDAEPKNAMANQMLAEIAMHKGQFKIAEDLLLKTVEAHPTLNLPLAKVQRQLKRSEEQIERNLAIAQAEFSARLIANPKDEQSRRYQAEALLMSRRFDDAALVLREGLALNDSAELRQHLASIYGQTAGHLIQVSMLNRELSQQLVAQAILLDPGNELYLQQALAFTGALGTVDDLGKQLQPAIDVLRGTEAPSMNQKLLLAEALATTGEFDEAIALTEELVQSNPKLRKVQAQLLRSAGRDAEATKLITKIVTDYRANFAADGEQSLNDICDQAEMLLIASDPEAAIEILFGPASDGDDQNLVFRRDSLANHAYVAAFDKRYGKGTVTDLNEALEFLNKATELGHVILPVIDRLARLSFSDSHVSEVANERLQRLLAIGNANAEIYNLVGTQALLHNDPQRARQLLERAYSLDSGNPMVLNNLSLALIRGCVGDSPDADRALLIANDALKILPRHPDVLATRAEVFIAMKRWEDARRDLETALPQRQKNADLRRLLAQVFDALGESTLASEHDRIYRELSQTQNGETRGG